MVKQATIWALRGYAAKSCRLADGLKNRLTIFMGVIWFLRQTLKNKGHAMSDYITPDQVDSPRRHWSLIKVLEDGAKPDVRDDCRVAIAIGTWRDEEGDTPDTVLGMRWNGNEDSRIGNPQSRGLPTWFIVPSRLNDAVIDTLSSEDNKALARSLLKATKR